MSEVRVTEIDGVRCYWVDSGRPTLAAELIVRFGRADEPFHESGWQHLLEHCALHGRGGGALHVNGSVDLLTTRFSAHGPADAVADHLNAVTRWLAAPELTDLEHESRVLRAERDRAGDVGPAVRALGWRYGATGPGLAAHAEPGLGRASADLLRERAARVFTGANAALVLDGPPPASLALLLPTGTKPTPLSAIAVEEVFPAAYVDPAGVVMSGTIDRDRALWVGHLALRDLLSERLREEDAAAYAPWSIYEPVDDARAIVMLGSDLSVEARTEGAARAYSVLHEILDRGVPTRAVEEMQAQVLQGMADPQSLVSRAYARAHAVLSGRPEVSWEERMESVRSITAEEVSDAVREWVGDLLLGIPGQTPAVGGQVLGGVPLLAYPETTSRTGGRRFRHRNWPASRATVQVDDDGVEIQSGRLARRADWSDVVGVRRYPDGARYLARRDGYGVVVDTRQWKDGERLLGIIDTATPPAQRLTEDRPFEAEFEQLPPYQRWRRMISQALDTDRQTTADRWDATVFWLVLALALLVLVVLTVASPHIMVVVGSIALGQAAIWAIRRRRERRSRGDARH